MLIRNIYIILLLCSMLSFAQNKIDKEQNFRISYDLEYSPDSTNLNRKEYDSFYLTISKDKSIFNSESEYLKDSILNSPNPNNLLKLNKSLFKNTIIKKNDKIINYLNYNVYRFIFDESINFKWELTKETKNILGYKCKSASINFKGRNYIAFYTDELPFSDGPYKFNGLPGLILEISDLNNNYFFKAVALKKLSKNFNYKIFNENSYKKIELEEIKKLEDKIKEKPSILIMNENIKLSDEAYEKYNRSYKEKNKFRNNSIELD